MTTAHFEVDPKVVKEILRVVEARALAHSTEPHVSYAVLRNVTLDTAANGEHIAHLLAGKFLASSRYGYAVTEKGQKLLAGLTDTLGWTAADAALNKPEFYQAKDPLRGLLKVVSAVVKLDV